MGAGWRAEDGQASSEYVALVLLIIAAVLGTGAAASAASPVIRNRITTSWQRAICVVASERCEMLDLEPCPVRRRGEEQTKGIDVGWLRLAHDRLLQIEQRSDGTFEMLLLEGAEAGVTAAAGRRLVGQDAEASAALTLGMRAGRVYRAPDAASARALVARLRSQRLPAARAVVGGAADLVGLAEAEPGVEAYVLAGRAAADAVASLSAGALAEAGVELGAAAELGAVVSARRREITAYVELDARAGAFFSAFGEPEVQIGGQRRRRARPGAQPAKEGTLGVTNPFAVEQELTAQARGRLALRIVPGRGVTQITVTLASEAGGSLVERVARIDPRDPSVAAALATWRRAPRDARQLAELGRAARESAALDVRRFRFAEDRTTAGVKVSLGASLGIDATHGLETATLLEQRSRPVGGVWESRIDCGSM